MILIAGSSGYVGEHLRGLLDSKNLEYVTIQVKDKASLEANRIYILRIREKYIELTAENLIKTLAELQIHSAVNLAADTSKLSAKKNREVLYQANIHYNYDLIEILIAAGVKNYHFITTYSSSTNGTSFSPQTFYAGMKYCAEKLIESYAACDLINATIIEIYDVYGPSHHNDRYVNYCLDSIIKGSEIRTSEGWQEINLVFINDLVANILTIVQNQLKENSKLSHFSIYSRETYKVREIPEMIAKILHLPIESGKIMRELPTREKEIMKVTPRFPRPLGWIQDFSFEQGIKEVYKKLNLS